MTTIKLRRVGPPCCIPQVLDVVSAGQVVEVPRGHGYEVPDGDGFAPAPGWEYAIEEEPAAAGGEDGER